MRIIIGIILGILLLGCISAEVIINPDPIQITLKKGDTANYTMNITNNYDFDIMNFTFGNLTAKGFIFPQNIQVPKNQSKIVEFTVSTTESIHEVMSVPVEFKFPVDLPNEPTVHNITITETGFEPDYLVIRQGDTVNWTNLDSVSHEVYSPLFSITIFPNQSGTWVFQTLGENDYYDPEWYGWGGFDATIEVVSKTSEEVAHNPNYDFIWTVNLNSILNPTNLSIENSKQNYEIEYGKFKKGLLTISNTGDEVAEVINLTADLDWISFNKNSINIGVGEEDWIEYSITPVVLDTNQTDKEYTVNIHIKASNSQEYLVPLKVYIPYTEIVNELGGSDIDTLNWLNNVFCPAHPTSFLCDPSVIYASNNSNTTVDDSISFNASVRDIFDMKKDIAKLKDSALRSDNELKLTSTTVNSELPSISSGLNSTNQEVKKLSTQFGEVWNILWLIGGGIVIMAVIWGIVKRNDKRMYKKALVEGGINYRK